MGDIYKKGVIVVNIKIMALFAFSFFLSIIYGPANTTFADQAGTTNQEPVIGHSGLVVSVKHADSYTYIELDEGDKIVWIAGPAISLKTGDKISTSKGAEMRDFFSKTFNKSFRTIFFVGKINIEGAPEVPQPEEESITINAAERAPAPTEGEISFSDDVYTLKNVFNLRSTLKGKRVKVRGKIVKASGSIMGKYWYHIQDGTDMGPHNADLVMTSATELEAGDVVEAVGMLMLDRDFGSGYKYPIILENAEIKVTR